MIDNLISPIITSPLNLQTLPSDISTVICINPHKTPRKTGEAATARGKRGALITSFRNPFDRASLKGERYFDGGKEREKISNIVYGSFAPQNAAAPRYSDE